MFNRLLVGALLASAIPLRASATEAGPTPALTASGGVALVSRYRFRGIGLSDERPALQGSLTLSHKSGAYASAWASSLDGFGELGGSNLELDLYAGYRRKIARGVTLDAGLLYYAYPGSKGGTFEFFEPYANVSGTIGPVAAKVGAAFAPRQDAIGGHSNLYLFADQSLPIPGTPLSLTSHLGWSKGRTTLTPGGDYVDWSLGAQASRGKLTAAIAYVDTDIRRRDALAAGATRRVVDGAIVLSLGASF